MQIDLKALENAVLGELARQGVVFGKTQAGKLDCDDDDPFTDELFICVGLWETEADLNPVHIEEARISNQLAAA